MNLPFFLTFVGTLAARFDAASPWPRVATAAVGGVIALFGAATATQALLVARASTLATSPDALALAWDLHSGFFAVNAAALGVLVGALALGARRLALVPRFAPFLGLAAAALLLAGAAAAPMIVAGSAFLWVILAGFVAWVAFLVAVSWAMLAEGRRGTSARPASSTA